LTWKVRQLSMLEYSAIAKIQMAQRFIKYKLTQTRPTISNIP